MELIVEIARTKGLIYRIEAAQESIHEGGRCEGWIVTREARRCLSIVYFGFGFQQFCRKL
jgi:hypothetical protein